MADLRVHSSIGVRSAAEGLFAAFERGTGHRLELTWGTAPMLVRRIEGGETADLLILSRAGIEALKSRGQIVPGSAVSLASSGVAIGVKAGARKPDISSPDALREALLAAKSVAYTEPSAGGASGVHFAKLLEHMGIAEAMRPKTKYPPPGGFSGALVVSGDAELAVQQKPELLHVEGIEIVGELPGELNLITEFVAGQMPECANKQAAGALIAHLRSPAAREAFRAKGLEPTN
jgi:molybdate transport system substrate-binding protein